MTVEADNNLCPIHFWDVPTTHTDSIINCVQYITLGLVDLDTKDQPGQGQSGQGQCVDRHWSIPVRMRMTEAGTRCNVSLPCEASVTSPYTTKPCILTTQEKFGIIYMVLSAEPHPPIELHNNCNFTIYYGQSLMALTIDG